MIDFSILLGWIIVIFLILSIALYITLTIMARKFYTPPYPPNLRGTIEIPPDFENLVKDETSWSKKLKVRVWNPINLAQFTGKTILFSHGWDSSMGFFNPHIKYFHGKNWRVIAMDLRSMGESEYIKFATAVNFADDIGLVIRWIHKKYSETKHLTIYAHSISGVSTLIGQGIEIIDRSLLSQIVVEGIYADGRYITDRFYKQYHVPKLFHKVFLILLYRRFRRCLPKDHPQYPTLFSLSNQHPVNHLPKLAKDHIPLIIIHAKNDQVVPFDEFNKYLNERFDNIRYIAMDSGGHFKVAFQEGFLQKLEQMLTQNT
jgi:pimeloyl-ACP methyl ester carboxylesterase